MSGKKKKGQQSADKAAPVAPPLQSQVQIDSNNLHKWRLAATGRMHKSLDDEATEAGMRYRNIKEPPPLL